MHTSTRSTALFLVVLSTCTAGWAQDSEPSVSIQEKNLLRLRGRAVMHPANPLELSGLEQHDNSMRAGTSALQRGDVATAGSDQDENYARAIAMVEDRAVFSRPPARATLPCADPIESEEDRSGSQTPARTEAQVEVDRSIGRPWEIGAGIAAALTVAAWAFTCRRD